MALCGWGGACMSPCSYVPTHSFPCASLAGKEKAGRGPFPVCWALFADIGCREYCCSLCSCGFGTTAYVAVKMRLGKQSGKRIEILFWCPGPKARRPRRSLYRLPGCLTPFYAAACRACMGMLALEDTVLCTQVCSEAFISAVSICGAVFFCRVVASYLHLANLVDYCLRLRLVRQHCVTVCG